MPRSSKARVPGSARCRGPRAARAGVTAVLAASLAACSLVSVKTPEKPLSARDLNARILTHEFSAHFIVAIEQTADNIAAGTADPQVRMNTLRWKIAAAGSSERAASQIVPMMSLLDTWALAVQMSAYLDGGAGRALFGAQQPRAVVLAADLAHEAEELARGLTAPQEFTADRGFVSDYAQAHPIESLSFARASIVDLWVQDRGTQAKLVDSLGTVPEALAEARDLARMYGDTAPSQLLWRAQLAAAESGLSGEDLQSALRRLDERMGRLSAMADGTPDLIRGVVREVRQRVDASWTEMLSSLRTQGAGLSSSLTSERQAATQALDAERTALAADASRLAAQVVHDAGEEARRLVREALLLATLLAVVVLGLPFAAGYLVGRARRGA